jgi:hypothetical protein
MDIAGPYWQQDPKALRQAARRLALRGRWSQRLPAGPRRP